MDILGSLSGASVKSLCSNHHPKASRQRIEGGYTIYVHCDNCNFTAWVHLDAYYDMMVDNMLDEVDESIKAEGE